MHAPGRPQADVAASSTASQRIASVRDAPHISGLGRKEAHTAGRRGSPKSAQRRSSVSCTHGTPAGLPAGMPGIALEIDGAVQQAAQPERQSIRRLSACGLSARCTFVIGRG